MNQSFNLTRFGRLLRKHAAEHLTSYAMSTAVLVGGVLVVLGSLTYLTRRPLEHELQVVLFYFGLLGAGSVFTASIFAEVGNPRAAASALLLPASHLEKYLVAWLYSLPLFVLVYTAVFTVVNVTILQLANQGYPYELYDFSRDTREWAGPLLSYALLHSITLWGAIYFRRLHVIKIAFLVFGLLLAVLLLNRQVLMVLIPGSRPVAPFTTVWVGKGGQALAIPDNQGQLLMALLPLVLAGLLWLAAYARLTEKQI